MATSGSYTFISNESEIINDAYAKMGIYFPGEEIPAEYYAYAQRALNRMIKFWARKRHLWTIGVATLFLQYNQNKYTIDNTTAYWTEEYTETTLSAAEALGQTILSVTSTSSMTVDDYIGIQLEDGTMQWSTIASIDSSTQLTINNALTDDVESGAVVYAFTTRAQPPVRVEWVVRRDSNDTDIELTQYSRKEYDTLPNKSILGLPVGYYYDPKVNSGVLKLYETPDDVSVKLNITYRRMVQDFNAASNTADFPIEWEECIISHLALRVASVGGIGADDPLYVSIREQAVDTLSSLIEHDQDNLPLRLEFDDEA